MKKNDKKTKYNPGLIHYKYGNGPGKSTSAFGIVIRAIGHGLKPVIIQFLKKSLNSEEDIGINRNLTTLKIETEDLISKYELATSSNTPKQKIKKNKKSTIKGINRQGFDYGEYKSFVNILNIPVIQLGTPDFIFSKEEPNERDLNRYKFGLELIKRLLSSDSVDLVVLDEIITAMELKLVDKRSFIEILKNKNKNIEVILTGREKIPEIIDLADYVTEFNSIKHPFQKNIYARKGAEY